MKTQTDVEQLATVLRATGELVAQDELDGIVNVGFARPVLAHCGTRAEAKKGENQKAKSRESVVRYNLARSKAVMID